jgi:antirestriction protein ArdC
VFWQKRSYTTRDEAGAEELRESLLLKVYTVFNIGQCEGVKLPGASKGPEPIPPPPVMLDVYDKLAARVEHGGDRACYVPSVDKVLMPRPEAFTSADAYAATGLHELTHWTGHGSRLDRIGTWGKRFGDRAYAAEELVAELGSAFLCAALGVNSALEHHASYIASWQDLLRHDSRAVFTAASKAQAAANWILGKVRPEAVEELPTRAPAGPALAVAA